MIDGLTMKGGENHKETRGESWCKTERLTNC
jgi:hypothetical protein